MVHKLPESESKARGQELFMAEDSGSLWTINPWQPRFICYILKRIGSVGP